MRKRHAIQIFVACTLLVCAGIQAQQKGSPLKNETIASMVKGGMPESLIVSTIQVGETQFDVTAGAVAELKKASVSQKVIDAMVAAEARKQGAVPGIPAVKPGQSAGTVAGPALQQPYVALLQGEAKSALPLAVAQVATLNANKRDLKVLAADAQVAQAMQAVAGQAASRAASDLGASAASSLGGAAGGVVGGLFRRSPPTVTYVWGVPGKPANEIAAGQPLNFEVAYDSVAGVNAEEFSPVLVRLVPARNEWRLVGATTGKEDSAQSVMPEWDLYSSFVEEKVQVNVKKLATGRFEIATATPLAAGEYAVVLRPVAKNKKFAGSQVRASLGEARLFNTVWTFFVPPGR